MHRRTSLVPRTPSTRCPWLVPSRSREASSTIAAPSFLSLICNCQLPRSPVECRTGPLDLRRRSRDDVGGQRYQRSSRLPVSLPRRPHQRHVIIPMSRMPRVVISTSTRTAVKQFGKLVVCFMCDHSTRTYYGVSMSVPVLRMCMTYMYAIKVSCVR